MRMWLSLTVVLLLAACGAASEDGADAGPTADASVPDAAGPACTGLALKDCRMVAGCVPDLCYACSCEPQFKDCRREADTPFECPILRCAQPACCGADGTCAGGELCVDPGDHPPGCGVCNPAPGNCTGDGDCTGGSICEPIHCSCDGERACVPGCTGDADCAKGDACDLATHRCAPISCGVLTPCPPNYACTAGTCTRATCASDVECDGFCVTGKCYDAQGTCEIPPP